MLKLFNCLFILSSLFGISNGQIQVPTAIVRMVAAPGSSVAGELVVKATVNGISIKGKITGLTPGLHGFHIHEHGNLGNGCRNAGGHFNPFHHDHGDPRDLKRHIGDLGNIEADETGTATVNIFDSQASMNPSSRAYIGNLSVVVHADRDDLGRGGNPESLKTGNAGARMGCGIIEVQQQQQQQQTQQQQMISAAFAKVTIVPGTAANLAGELIVTATGGGVIIEGEITGLTPGLHGFHIHATGDLGNNCKNAGGHFNPFGLNHGGPQDVIRHVGDLGNIEADATGTANIQIFAIQPSLDPSSPAYIGNLAVVVHAGRDDLGKGGNPESLKTGNAGARLGCGIIEVQQQQQQTQQQAAFAKVTIVPGTAANLAGELIVTATGGGVIIEGEITGLTPGLHGFHIHATGDLGNNCKNAGGHFNPFGLNHGGPQDVIRHVGDLGNIEADATGTANIQIFAIQPSLDPSSPAYIGNLAVVVHAGRDDLGKGGNPESLKTGNAGARLGCGIIEVQQQQQQTQQQAAFAKVTIVPGTAANLAGELIVTATGGGVIIEGEITGLTPGLHGFHIHATGDLGNNCKNAGGHFNPFGLNHGGPQDVIRHVGDLGNIETDATGTANIQIFAIQPSLNPSSPAYIGNLAVVVHAGRDDLGKGGNPESLKTGNAGARLGCGIIEVQQQQQQTQQQAAFAKVTIVPGTAANLAGELIVTATGGGVIIEGEITGLTPGLHGFHIHATGDLGNNCKNAGGHFNPFGLNHGGPQDVIRHVGDLGNIEADATGTANIQIFDIQPSLDPSSPAYIGNLAVVVHAGRDDLGKGGNPESLKTGNAGARLGCGIIEVAQHQKDFAQVRLIPGSNLAIAGELVICPTEKGVVLRGEITGLTPGLHGFHIHETGDLGNGCKNAGGHFNPFGANHGGPQDATRHVGDLGNIIADERGTAVIEIFDDIASMDRSSTAYIGNLSVVVHADRDDLGRGGNPESLKTGNAGARMGCGIIEVEHFSSFPPVTQRQLPEIPLVDHAVVEIIPGTNPNITGNLLITKTEGGVVFAGQITGLTPGLHGFHIHSTGDLGNSCKNAGGHFNPFGLNHGGPEDAIRHVGDLGNIEADETGTANIQIFDTQPSLDPFSLAYIGSLSVVVHAGRDDLGRGGNPESLKTGNAGARMGCGVIQICYQQQQQQQQQQKMIYGSLIGAETRQVDHAVVEIIPGTNPNITGNLLITKTEGGVVFAGQITGLTPGLHGFHIHSTGDLGNSCKNAGGHFNPFGLNHGGPEDAIRHVGDLGNIEADETGIANIQIFDTQPSLDPFSLAYIGSLSVVVHAGRDDLGRGGNPESLKTGNAGARMGCGVIQICYQQQQQQQQQQQMIYGSLIGAETRQNGEATVRLVPGSAQDIAGELLVTGTQDGVIIKGQIIGLTPGLHGFHIHETGDLGNGCKNAGGHFNPFGLNHGGPGDANRHVGDLGNIEVDETGKAVIEIFDSEPSLDPSSITYIGNLSMVVHAGRDDLGKGGNPESLKTGNAGARMGCGVINVLQEQHRQRSTSRQKRSFIPENFHDLFSDPFRSSATDHFGGIGKKAHVKIIPGNSTKVHGQLEINDVHSGLIIKGIVYGLKPGLHGFHVHEKGGLGNKCQDAGGHFNPFNTNHGDVHDFHRHVGDLGNIKADGKGVAHIDIFDHKGSLDPHAKTFIGKLAIVVHANPDDLGRGKNEDSKRTGNSGTRVGCGVVELKSTSHGGHHGHHFHGHAAHHSQPVHHGHHPYPSHHHQPHHGHHQTHSSYHHAQHLGHPQKQHHGEKHHTSHHHNVPVYKPKEKPQLNLGHGQSHNHDHGFGHGFGPENFY